MTQNERDGITVIYDNAKLSFSGDAFSNSVFLRGNIKKG